MSHAVLYKYINCADDKLLALVPVTNYNTNYSEIINNNNNNNVNNNNNNNMILIISFC